MKEHRLPEAEFAVMKVVWSADGPVTSARIMEEVGRERGWKPQTLLTLLSRLTERGFIEAQPGKGREKLFACLVSREEYLARETSAFMDEVHGRSVGSLLAALNRERLSEQDMNELQAWFDRLKKGGA